MMAHPRGWVPLTPGFGGAHRLETVTATEQTVMVNGVFAGVAHDGSARCAGFADVWEFADTGLVANRKTYLALGSGYVKE